MKAKKRERRIIQSGSVVSIGGLPVRVCRQFVAETHPENWAMINIDRIQDGLEPFECQPRT